MGSCATCGQCLFWSFSVFTAVVAILSGIIYYQFKETPFPEDIALNIGAEGVQIFKAFDINDDNYLSAEEFEPLYHSLIYRDGKDATATLSELIYEQPIADDDEILTVMTKFQPLLLESMKRSQDEVEIVTSEDCTRNLKAWTTPNHEWMNFGVSNFKSFFPPEGTELGTVYEIIKDAQSFLERLPITPEYLSSNRYFPSHVKEDHRIIYRLLQLFHPRPFIMMRFQPRDSVAVVRASNEQYMEIFFRIHAEFQLNELPNFPFWFTPAQFTGSLIVSRDFKHIAHFHLYVPTNQSLNVDMEWLDGQSDMTVDIGYMPEMALNITSPSVPVSQVGNKDKLTDKVDRGSSNEEWKTDTVDSISQAHLMERLPDQPFDVDSIPWRNAISVEEANYKLDVKLYPFKKVKYYNLTESLDLAKKEDKMLHHIVLWGALDDQSC